MFKRNLQSDAASMKLITALSIKNNSRIYLLIFSECFAIVKVPTTITHHRRQREFTKKNTLGQTAMTADWPKRMLCGYWFLSKITSQK